MSQNKRLLDYLEAHEGIHGAGYIKRKSDHNSLDLAGKEVGYLVVLERTNKRYGTQILWRCKCICGRDDFLAASGKLGSGGIKSCGCKTKDILREAQTKHGKSKGNDRTYQIWLGIKERCEKPYHKSYKHYGGRGIKVCERWMEFINFQADMGECPDGLQIDRINNDFGYEPGNCRWTTAKINSNNRSNNRRLNFNGLNLTFAEWCDQYGIRIDTLQRRIALGWSVEDAITKPVRAKKNNRVAFYRLVK